MRGLMLMVSLVAADPAGSWPAFRGDGSSVTTAEQLPLSWNDTTNIAWSVDLQGYGQSSPVIWGDEIFVTSVAGDMKDRLLVSAFDLATGQQRWSHESAGTQKIKSSEYVSRGAPTPAVDAESVFAFFESGDLVALDHTGQLRWERSLVADYGEFQGNHGIGTSVAQTSEAVILLIDHSGPSYLLALDKRSGKTLWKIDREPRVSWSTPLVLAGDAGTEIVLSSNGQVEGFDAADGSRKWWLSGLKGNTVASPTADGEWIVVGASAPHESLALRRGAAGELAESQVAWRAEDATSSFGSPLIYQGRVYLVSKSGVAYCLDLRTGREIWNERLGNSCWASPVGAGDRIYFFLTTGETVVYKSAEEGPEELARNLLSQLDKVYGVALSDGQIAIRGGNKLIMIRASQ